MDRWCSTPLSILTHSLAACVSGLALEPSAREALLDPATDPVGLARLADRHRVLTMLAPAFSAHDLISRLPEDFGRYLRFMHARNEERNQALRAQLLLVAALLNRIGVEPILLKGAVRLVDRLYPDLGWRFMRDLDLLVPPKRLDDANAFLRQQGFEPTRADDDWPNEHHHLPPLHRDGDAAVIEIHGQLLRHDIPLCPTARVLERARPLTVDGAVVRVPVVQDQIGHLIGHSRFDDDQRRSGLFTLQSLFELALLGREAGGFATVRARTSNTAHHRYATRRMAMAARLFPKLVTAPPSPGFAAGLGVHALLGIERLDAEGSLRRLIGFSRTRAKKLLHSPADRRHLSENILKSSYHRRSLRRLSKLWLSS